MIKLFALTPDQRRWLYGVSTALVALAVAYGLVAQDQAALWVALAVAAFSGGSNVVAGRHVADGYMGRHRSDVE